MTEQDKHKRQLWYTRRDGVVRGPYPEGQINRYILLGRIGDHDQLRHEDGAWAELAAYPELIPEVMKLPPTDENLQKLAMARMREDERRPRDRRDGEVDVPAEVRERRSGEERRRPEPQDMLRHRMLKYQVAHTQRNTRALYRYPAVLAGLVLVGFALSFVLRQTEPDLSPPDCSAAARPGVNWDHCNLAGLQAGAVNLVGAHLRNTRLDAADLRGASLTGANLEYASINLGNLRAADFSHARLVGATVRGSDLRNVRFNNADLSYANLSDARLEGADFSGANLSHVIWVDRKPCLAGSVGACNRARER